MKPIAVDRLPLPSSSTQGLVDTHCHLHLQAFDEDRAEVVAHAKERGVNSLVVVGAAFGLEGNSWALQTADEYPEVRSSIGLHPHDADQWNDETLNTLRTWGNQHQPVAIGETGLDFYYKNATPENQKRAFAGQLALAEELGLPLIVHTRLAHEATLTHLKAHTSHIRSCGGIIHCFSEGPNEVETYLAMGLTISFSGIITFPKADDVRAALKRVPLDRLLIETDAPFLAPHPCRGLRNEPACLVWTAERAAAVKEVSTQKLIQTIQSNAKALFRLNSAEK